MTDRSGVLGAVTMALLAGATACASELGSDADREASRTPEVVPPPARTPLERARAMASRDGWLSTAFHRAKPLVPSKSGFDSAVAGRGDTACASFGNGAAGPFSLRAGNRNRALAEFRVSGIPDVPLTLEEGSALSAELAPGVVAFYGLAGESLEQVVLSSTGAPLAFAWHLTFPGDITGSRRDRTGNLDFVRSDGRAVVRVPRPYAVDEAGTKLDVTMTWNEHRDGDHVTVDVHFTTPDGHGRALLVDPALEVVFWQENTAEAPPSRHSAGFVYHPDLQASILYGGSAFDVLSDTWAFSSTEGTWRQINAAGRAPARYGHAMSYFKGASTLVAFGGRDEAYALSGSTLLWDGQTWTDSGVSGPPARDSAAMAYAPVLGTAQNVAFLFGGSASGAQDDSWTWSGTRWNAVTAPDGADARYGHDVFYDDARKSVVVFGGARATLLLSDVTTYDGSKWTALTPASTARTDAAMAFDTKRKVGVLFGGLRTLDEYAKGTWEWHSVDGTWVERVTQVAPVSRAQASMTYDPKRERAVMYGGAAGSSYLETSETWEYGVLGGSCTTTAECDEYACVDGACCEVSKCGPCTRCSVDTGACEPVLNDDDPDSCTGASTCDAEGACKKKPGAACTAGSDCVSGFCADGVCCNARCSGSCEACDVKGEVGKCSLVRGAARHGACDGNLPCGSTCTGDSAECRFTSSGVSCGSSCDGDELAARTCDGKGACASGPAKACPNDLRCADDTVCRTDCEQSEDCTGGHVCQDGACTVAEDFCEDATTLRTIDGESSSCEPYRCLSGACLETCSTASQCKSGLVCDAKHHCIAPPLAGEKTEDSGCGCAVPGREPQRSSGALVGLGLALVALLGRRRFKGET